MLINIEGTDGSGKGTQTKLLASRLRRAGYNVRTIAFPRHGHPAAWTVDQYLKGHYGSLRDVGPFRGSLLYAIDRFDASFQIQQWLNRGTIVIADRYPVSNCAHQGSKITSKAKRKAFWQWNLDLEHRLLRLPKPTHIVILHVPVDISYKLIAKKKPRTYLQGKKRDIMENDKKHLRLAERVFVELASYLPNAFLLECAPSGTLLSKKEIHEKIYAIVQRKLKSGVRS